jgi:hypothetical protein
MYANDVREVMRDRMVGAHALDPTIPHRDSRSARMLHAFAAVRRERAAGTARGARRSASPAPSPVDCCC